MHDDWRAHSQAPAPGSVLCRVDEIPDNGGHVLAFGDDTPFRMVLLRNGSEVVAWHNRCPHFGMPLALKNEWLIFKPKESLSCNVHYARFNWRSGLCEAGDCEGEQLTPLPVSVCGENVVFDLPDKAAGNTS